MSSAVLERSVRTPMIQGYSPAFHEPTLADSTARAWLYDIGSVKMLASLVAGAMATSASAVMPMQPGAHTTFGQVRAVNASTLVELDQTTAVRPTVDLSIDEHQILRNAIWDSAEIVAKGRFVEL
ncbi:MAG: hypothetical protein EON58_15565 [Alphaproteobacteria bacterium]|nr:MAG: hypothetical protein EON58_15565 [Alphaproteobacteria bacterium]